MIGDVEELANGDRLEVREKEWVADKMARRSLAMLLVHHLICLQRGTNRDNSMTHSLPFANNEGG